MKIIGIMSGTSVDGVDYILCESKGQDKNLKYLSKAYVPFTKELKSQILKAASNELDFWSVAQLHYDLGEFYSESLKKIKKQKNWSFKLIGLHGQTVFHAPKKSTLQIGEASFLKKDFDIPVVSQFRNIDIALQGQGAPFAPFFHKKLMQNEKKTWAFQNLGGIGNVTTLQGQKLMAFDTGPANIIIDEYMRALFNKELDTDGSTASQGLPDVMFANSFVSSMPYFKLKPPKSCGRENFSSKALDEILKPLSKLTKYDQIATLTEITVLSIKDQYQKFLKKLPEVIVVSGGGAKNKYMMERLKFHMPSQKIMTSLEYCGWPVDAIEGGAFAWMAYARLNDIKIKDLTSVTGAKKISTLGVLY